MLRLSVGLAIFCISVWAQNTPVREASSPSIIGTSMPAFYNGYLYSCQPQDTLTLFAPDGQVVLTLSIKGPNGNAGVLSAAVDLNGTLAIARRDVPANGIDIRDLSGKLIRSIDTGRYVPAHLSFGQDHSLWSFGWQVDASDPFRHETADYLTIRKYSIDGQQTGGYLPRSLFPAGLEPGNGGWQARHISASGDRVGIEAMSGESGDHREWVELDLNGNLLGRWKLDPSYQFPGVALTSDGNAYRHRYDREAKSWRVFRLDRAAAKWEPVNGPNVELYGADGDMLVYAKWYGGVMHMSWYPQPKVAITASEARD